ncbi:MAG: hypothetical protein ACJ8DC_03520 [Gemmatimonadales bacterium]
MLRLMLVLLALLLVSQPSAAQAVGLVRGPSPSSLFLAQPSLATRGTPDTTAKRIPATHWRRGLLIGGTIGGVGLGALVYAFCQDLKETDRSCLGPAAGGAVLGAVMGGVTGALIGGAFRKPVPADSTPGTR